VSTATASYKGHRTVLNSLPLHGSCHLGHQRMGHLCPVSEVAGIGRADVFPSRLGLTGSP
jgi:hypothetical protein